MRAAPRLVRAALLAGALSLAPPALAPETAVAGPVAVRQREGVTHGFLVVRSATGEVLAEGDLLQSAREEVVDSRLVFRFRDGSLHDERVVFSQQGVFRLLSYRLQQRGPSFPEEVEVTLERDRDQGRYRATSRRAGEDVRTERGETDLPPDAYNGMTIMLLRNLPRGAGETVHQLAFTPKPILIRLELHPRGEEPVTAGDRRVSAIHYVLTPKLGLLRGAAAAVLGKTPPDYHALITTGEIPAFVAIDGPLYTGGPIWRIETVSPRAAPGRPGTDR
jgi:hypothetical protein